MSHKPQPTGQAYVTDLRLLQYLRARDFHLGKYAVDGSATLAVLRDVDLLTLQTSHMRCCLLPSRG